MSRADLIKIHPIEARGRTYECFVSESGNFGVNLDGTDDYVWAHDRDALRTKQENFNV